MYRWKALAWGYGEVEGLWGWETSEWKFINHLTGVVESFSNREKLRRSGVRVYRALLQIKIKEFFV